MGAPDFWSRSKYYVRTHQQAAMRPTLKYAIRHLEAALDLRDAMARGGPFDRLFVRSFVAYKGLLRLISDAVVLVRRARIAFAVR